jgi:hypothetical protein
MSTAEDSSSTSPAPTTTVAKECGLCHVSATMICGGCRSIYYCCKEHQKEHWKTHKASCNVQPKKNIPSASSTNPISGAHRDTAARRAEEILKELQSAGINPSQAYAAGNNGGLYGNRGNRGINSLPPNNAWANGWKSEDEMYEWFVDCYRMRLDDDYAVGGGKLRGLYIPENSKKDIVADLLVFAKLSHLHGCLPNRWSWSRFLDKAKTLVMYAFEKSDAKEKYGGENVFAVMTGGRSLRATAEMVYATGVQESSKSDIYRTTEKDVLKVFKARNPYDAKNEAIFADVGGSTIWNNFQNGLVLVDR